MHKFALFISDCILSTKWLKLRCYALALGYPNQWTMVFIVELILDVIVLGEYQSFTPKK
jgi:hypothetical protein